MDETLPSAEFVPAPEQLGDYRLLRRLGRGGMGTVYLGEHVQTGGRYAVKTLSTLGDPEWTLRFRREGEAQARVDRHPNVVRVHASGRERSCLYLVMDLLEGGDLGARLRGGALPPDEAATLVRDLALGVSHVHARGVLHRDIKPSNVLLDGETPKLVDFGLARVAGNDELTRTGTVLGTPAYMAPEQVEGLRAAVTERTDVYGLGALLYHCLTGEPPFKGASALAVMSQVAREEPPPVRNLRPEVPVDLERLCHKALSKAPEERQASAAELAEELTAHLEQGRSSRFPAWLGAVAVAPVLVFVVTAALLGDPPRRAAPDEPSPPAPPSPAAGEEEGSASSLAGEAPLPSREETPTWPIDAFGGDAAARQRAESLYETSNDPDHRLPVAAQLARIEEAARLGYGPAIGQLGRRYLYGLRPSSFRPGLGLQLLRQAVKHGDPRAAKMLATVHSHREGYNAQDRRGVELQQVGSRLGVSQDPRLLGALLRIANPDLDRSVSGSVRWLAEGGPEIPPLPEAYAIVQQVYEPPALAAAMRRAEQLLDEAEAGLTPAARAAIDAELQGLTGSQLMKRVRVEVVKRNTAVAVHVLREGVRRRYDRSLRKLGQLLLFGRLSARAQGISEAGDPQASIREPVPLAGIRCLFLGAEREDPEAMSDLARAYLHMPQPLSVIDHDPQVAGAYAYLISRLEDDEARTVADNLKYASPAPLPAPSSPEEAWGVVRGAVPW